MAVLHKLLSPADFEAMIERGELGEDKWYELVGGEVICLPPPAVIHGWVTALIMKALFPFADIIGAVLLSESTGFITGGQHQQVRQPDVSLLAKERLRLLEGSPRLVAEAPDLAVEVLSPEQHGDAYAIPKVAEYLAAGSKVVWLADPETRTVKAYEAGKPEYTVYSGEDVITLDAIAPGFAARVSSFFPA